MIKPNAGRHATKKVLLVSPAPPIEGVRNPADSKTFSRIVIVAQSLVNVIYISFLSESPKSRTYERVTGAVAVAAASLVGSIAGLTVTTGGFAAAAAFPIAATSTASAR